MSMGAGKYIRWLPGILIAMLGVCIARLLAPTLANEYQSLAFIVGTCVAIAGIFIAAAGANKPIDSSSVKKQT